MDLSAYDFERVTKTTYGHQKRYNKIVVVEIMDHSPLYKIQSAKGHCQNDESATPIKLVVSEIGSINVKHKVSLSFIAVRFVK